MPIAGRQDRWFRPAETKYSLYINQSGLTDTLTARTARSANSPGDIGVPADPRFDDPLSGHDWKVADDRGQSLRSRSLWDTVLALPADIPSPGEIHHHQTIGPADAKVLTAELRVILTVGDHRRARPLTEAVDRCGRQGSRQSAAVRPVENELRHRRVRRTRKLKTWKEIWAAARASSVSARSCRQPS